MSSLPDYGIYNCRPVRGMSGGYSIHSEGRAVDLGANAKDARHRQVADRYCDFLIANAEVMQVQYLIWNRRSWKPGRGWRAYNGVNPHTDHVHAELNRDGAARVTPAQVAALWSAFNGGTSKPAARLLRLGVEGDDVYDWTTILVGAGLLAQPTKVFSQDVHAATHRFQGQLRIKQDGVVGDETRTATDNLLRYLAAVESAKGRESRIRGLQTAFRQAGEHVEVTGVLDDATRRAMGRQMVGWQDYVEDHSPSLLPRLANHPAVVAWVQTQGNRLVGGVAVDGIPGPQTNHVVVVVLGQKDGVCGPKGFEAALR